MRLLIRLSIIVAAFLVLSLFCEHTHAETKIGILMWNKQPRYLQNTTGVLDYLKQQGFREPGVKVIVESADGNKVKAVEMAHAFVAAKMDLVITVGTTATVIGANEIKDIPLVFVMVWDPVGSKVAKSWKSSGNNTTGASSKTSALNLLQSLKKFSAVKKIAVLYTPGERNSEIQLKEFLAEQEKAQIKIIPVPLKDQEMVGTLMADVVTRVDAVCLAGSSVIGTNLHAIVDIATKAGVITASQSEDLVEGGALLGITVDPYAIGLLAGKKAVQVLKGTKPSSIPIEAGKKFDLLLNMKTAKAGQFQIPQAFMKAVTKIVE
jgi:putative tryptophan/tyrosine transport system substrate-binding protein